MADLDSVLIFVKVAQFESITRAARSLGMPISTVSRRLSLLEAELGVSLLRRTTRRVSLTAPGREYFGQCQEPLNQLQEAERVLTQAHKRPEGLLRVTVPVSLGLDPLFEFMSTFLKEYPRIRVELLVTNVLLDLIADNVDIAVRLGELRDSSVVGRRLGTSVYYLVAAPQYLEGRELPAEPADLTSHDCVIFNGRNNERDWELLSGKKTVRVHVSARISCRDVTSTSAFVRRGHGIGLLPLPYCEDALARGTLVRLLPKWVASPLPVFAVYASRKFLPQRLSAFLEALVSWAGPLWIKD